MRHEYWPGGAPSTPSDLPPGTTAVEPDLEDIVIALSLARRNTVPS
jgi:ABC-2 type transport system ATP-binding protein